VLSQPANTEWDAFVCIPIADTRLDEIRKRCANLHGEFRVRDPHADSTGQFLLRSWVSAEGQDVVRAYIQELEGA